MAVGEGVEWGGEVEGAGVDRDTEALARYGLRVERGHLPSDAHYEAGLAVYAVTEADVALDAVLPVSRLQTADEIDRWEAREKARLESAARRGPRMGETDPRDFKLDTESVLPDENPAGVPINRFTRSSTPEELAVAERVLRRRKSSANTEYKRAA